MSLVSRQNLFPTSFTVVVHLVIVASLFWSWHVMPPTLPPPPPSIKAKLVKMNAVPAKMRPKPVDKKAPVANRNEPVEQPEPPKPEPKPEPKKQEDLKKQEEQKAISLAKKEQEKKAEEEKKQEELKKKAEIEKKQEEEKKKKAEEDKKKKEQEAKKKAEEQKKREAEAKRKKLEAQRKAELARQLTDEMAEDEQYLDAQAEEEAAMSYMDVIREAVARNWNRPPSARNGMVVALRIQLIPNGQVVNVSVVTSSGNDAFDRSAVAAVKKAERFPELQDMPSHVFDAQFRQLTISFRPEDLRL